MHDSAHRNGCADYTLWVACMAAATSARHPVARAKRLLAYLEVFPTGRQNRIVTEAVETCLDQIHDPIDRATVQDRLRSLREPFFPPIFPSTLLSDPPPAAPA